MLRWSAAAVPRHAERYALQRTPLP